MRSVAIFLVAFLAVCALAEKHEMSFTVAGTSIGTNSYEVMPDGTFTSETQLTVPGAKIVSTLTGRITNGELVSYELKQTAGKDVTTWSAHDGKLTISSGSDKHEVKYSPQKTYIANYHPFLTASIARAFKNADTSAQTIAVWSVEAGQILQMKVTRKGTRATEISGVKKNFQVFAFEYGSTALEFFVSDSGNVVVWSVPSQRLEVIEKGFESVLVDPTTLYPELSQPTSKAKTLKNVRIKMRDGVETAADIAMPAEQGAFPTILVRTPYGRDAAALEGDWWAKRGYVYVCQDVRGRGNSDGDWKPFFNERKDGYDTIEWLAKQPWCNGKVGMIGGSYLGLVQWQAAVERPAALKCIIPQVSPPDPFFNIPYDHGIPFIYGAVWWARVVQSRVISPSALSPITSLKKFATLPLTKVDDALLGNSIPFVDDWWKRETASAFAGVNYFSDLRNVNIPALMVSGWWDGDGIGTKINYAAMRAMQKRNQYLIYGPWTHAFNTSSKFGDANYGSGAILELNSVFLRWFDRWLKDKAVWTNQPKVRVFVTGANQWRNLNEWPDTRSKPMVLYFNSRGDAIGKQSKGLLAPTISKNQKPDSYIYDPAKVRVPDKISPDAEKNANLAVIKTTSKDVIAYRTKTLTAPLEIGGPISVDLYFSTSVVDTDFFAVLTDEDEKGVDRMICLPGKIRAKFRDSYDRPEFLKAGQPYKVTLDLWDTAHQFKAGHKICLIITSEMFPTYARNLNTGEPVATGTRMVAAHTRILHDSKHPSALRFVLLPK